MKTFILGDIICQIGETVKENWKLLSNSKPTYLFFHLSSFTSGYVIMECDEYPCIELIESAAELCKEHRNLKNIKADYTMCKNVEKGDFVGEAIYKSIRKVKKIMV